MTKAPAYRSTRTALVCGCIRRVSAMLALFVLANNALASQGEERTIRIVSGSYGQNCGAPRGNQTRDFARQCDGLMTCGYTPRATHRSRPAAKCRSGFVAEWRCGSADFHTAALSPEAGGGDTLVLSCVIERGAGK
jgi:hypothetical protein